MIIDSGFTAKSGQGTPMYSRRGKSTINHYLCFTKNPEEIQNQRHLLVQKRQQRIAQQERGTTKSSVEQLADRILFVELEQKKALDQKMFQDKNNDQIQKSIDIINQFTNTSNQGKRNILNESGKSGSAQQTYSGSYAFRSAGRDKNSYYDKLAPQGPPIGHYTPQLSQIKPASQKYSITPETNGVVVKKPIFIQKQCIKNKECTFENRIQLKMKDSKSKKGESGDSVNNSIQKDSFDTRNGKNTANSSIVVDNENDRFKRQKTNRPFTAQQSPLIKQKTKLIGMVNDYNDFQDASFDNRHPPMLRKNTKSNIIRQSEMENELTDENNYSQQMALNKRGKSVQDKRTRSRLMSAKSNSAVEDYSMINRYMLQDVRPSAIQFDKQVSRDEIKHSLAMRRCPSKESPHFKRFESVNDASTVISSTKKVVSTDWRRESPKKTLLNQLKNQFYNCGDYTPNFNRVESKLDVGHVSFHNQMGRDEIYHYRKRHANKSQLPSYMTDTLKNFNKLGHIQQSNLVDFQRVKPRDHKMYFISESYNLNDLEKHVRINQSKFHVFNHSVVDINSNLSSPLKSILGSPERNRSQNNSRLKQRGGKGQKDLDGMSFDDNTFDHLTQNVRTPHSLDVDKLIMKDQEGLKIRLHQNEEGSGGVNAKMDLSKLKEKNLVSFDR
ncbi:UNKNOWN [Stylonychia lemnae]|uniref:Uncharacterized protein n=1 Tax=Stylonychia lemnae TaxID=5949 RepID=A0A078B4P8_STYLE|nr:UNKNOWN [Stylonychia lemnae]|eukprot:CDW89399.1 UNKNOWN [Stylonychia lemnae]